MKALLLGIDGLSYSSFMKCNPRFLLTLFSSTFRGVVVNRKPQHPASSWMSLLEMREIPFSDFETVQIKPALIRETESTAVNIPISNPTYGEVSLKYGEISLQEEINKVTEGILSSLDEGPVIASITGLDVILHRGADKCQAYSTVDAALRKLVNAVDDFIIFSPFGEPKSTNESEHEDYGVYLGTAQRPAEHETIKLPEIGYLFMKLVKG
ncbi:hypothetical protein [Metallosphaera hakonensis]|uniref:Uncharacterized protein n=1 Tax=Metallosphaera hakonensis JCM 8857 = DSM 7519 TaxID=1293036 RepID=A0A2U9ISD8_9CREN|nr:hypothetical protein [Metallosphaera hakonensis]AWR98918.1 hypothetical protein DFR87_03540 [Metallosphaera hakonensis JCM 8857 = DSM 7519]